MIQADTKTCLTCAHHDLIVYPPSTNLVFQCWSPDYETVGRWYTAQSDHGPWVLILDCTSYEPADLNSRQKGL